MDPVTHVVTGIALSQFVSAPSRGWAALAGLLFALLPDLDYVLRFNNPLAYMKHHRGFSHSLIALVLYVIIGAGLGRLIGGPRWTRPLIIIGFVVLISHLFLDWATSYGTQLLNPFTRVKFSLDWVFIIDPYLTALLVVAAVAAIWSGFWARTAGAAFMGLAGAYILLCAFYHHQALNLAGQVYQNLSGADTKIAALPQPFSPRRWLLIANTPGKIRQAFVELPYLPVGGVVPSPTEIPVHQHPPSPLRVPPAAYRPPGSMEVHLWEAAPPSDAIIPSKDRWFLDTYLEFSRFPILVTNNSDPSGRTLTWLDLRFSVPGRELPFVLEVYLDKSGQLAGWRIGGVRLPFRKPSVLSPHSG